MRHGILLAFLLGVLVGSGLLWAGVEISGGWYTYAIWDRARCYNEDARRASIGATTVAPGQPHPCLFRTPRFQLP